VVTPDAGDEESTAQSSKKNSNVVIDLRFIPTPQFFFQISVLSRIRLSRVFQVRFSYEDGCAIFILDAWVPVRNL